MDVASFLSFVVWVLPPVAGTLAYRKLAWLGSPPIVRTQRQMFSASGASLLLCLVFLGCAAFEALVFRDVPIAQYFGLAFPKPPGLFVVISFFFTMMSLLLALHGAILHIDKTQ